MRALGVCYDRTWAARNVGFELAEGEIGCLLGPSGCGKTTILRAIAGFLTPQEGSIHLAGEEVCNPQTQLRPEKRRVGIVLQDLALFPHLTVADNIGFGLDRRDAKRDARVAELLALTGLGDQARSYPHQISGGQQQRVAIARAMAPRPRLLLLDEPFSSLDPRLRDVLPRELRRLFHLDGMTALLVTHDQHEAFAMADRIGVMDSGRLEQWDTALALYQNPATLAVAGFVGQGALVPGKMAQNGGVNTELGTLPCETSAPPGSPMLALVRPDDLVHDETGGSRLKVVDCRYRGSHTLYSLELADGQVLCRVAGPPRCRPGETLPVRPSGGPVRVFKSDAG